jgi:hypothetical protein
MSKQENKHLTKLSTGNLKVYQRLKKLADAGKGIGNASPELIAETIERIESGSMSEGSFFAMRYQLLPPEYWC